MWLTHLIRSLRNVLIGNPQLNLIHTIESKEEAVKFKGHAGLEIKIFCIEKIYDITYNGLLQLFNRSITTYTIYGSCNQVVPRKLELALITPLVIPALLPNYHTALMQKKEAISAYVSYLQLEVAKK